MLTEALTGSPSFVAKDAALDSGISNLDTGRPVNRLYQTGCRRGENIRAGASVTPGAATSSRGAPDDSGKVLSLSSLWFNEDASIVPSKEVVFLILCFCGALSPFAFDDRGQSNTGRLLDEKVL